MLFQSVKNQKRSGETCCITSASWLAKKIHCAEATVRQNILKLKKGAFLTTERSKKFTKVYKGYVCDLKVIPLILSDFDSQITNFLNENKEFLNQIKENDLDTAENKGSHSLACETIKETIKKEIYIKEKKSVDLTPEKKSEKSGEDLDE